MIRLSFFSVKSNFHFRVEFSLHEFLLLLDKASRAPLECLKFYFFGRALRGELFIYADVHDDVR